MPPWEYLTEMAELAELGELVEPAQWAERAEWAEWAERAGPTELAEPTEPGGTRGIACFAVDMLALRLTAKHLNFFVHPSRIDGIQSKVATFVVSTSADSGPRNF